MKQMMQITKLRLLVGLLSGVIPNTCLRPDVNILCKAHFFANNDGRTSQKPQPIQFDENLLALVDEKETDEKEKFSLKGLVTKSLKLSPYIHTRASIISIT